MLRCATTFRKEPMQAPSAAVSATKMGNADSSGMDGLYFFLPLSLYSS